MGAKLIALILPLGLGTFAVAAALGALGVPREHRLNVATEQESLGNGLVVFKEFARDGLGRRSPLSWRSAAADVTGAVGSTGRSGLVAQALYGSD
jgi:hypothetical protein